MKRDPVSRRSKFEKRGSYDVRNLFTVALFYTDYNLLLTVVSLGRFFDAFSLISAIQCFILGRDYMERLVGIQIIRFSWADCVGTMDQEWRSAGFLLFYFL